MRVLQLIDSLEAGGAERMAINYANALAKKNVFSSLVVTRKEGILKSQIHKDVAYLFLSKKSTIDIRCIIRLRKYIVENKIEFLHAHSSSFFLAFLVKLICFKVKIVWHDHYGISQDLYLRKNLILKCCSALFFGVISVNKSLKLWASSYLWCSNVRYIPNFICEFKGGFEKVVLKGIDKKRIICVANLRPQKNHTLLIEAANLINSKFNGWTFHLFGKNFGDSYSDQLSKKVINLKLEKVVYFYDSVDNISVALKQCDIAVLPSSSEGLPLAVLEYGLSNLPVIATDVGEISQIITSVNNGIVVQSDNLLEFTWAIQSLIESEDKRIQMGKNLNKFIKLNFCEESIIEDYILWLRSKN